MKTSYFLGANTKDGFYSLYGGFAVGESDFLHIIKGGPGTGKSSFMRKIGMHAEKLGYDVQYVLCSGDPDSLDGVYIPAIRTGWMDGTAPHPAEPRHFGTDSDYVNLGRFCRAPLSLADKGYVNQLTDEYKSYYSRAYALLSSASQLRTAYMRSFFGEAEFSVISKRISGILDRQTMEQDLNPSLPEQIFLSALSCRGQLRLGETVFMLCKHIYQLDDGLGGADMALKEAARAAKSRRVKTVLCPSPFDPSRLEAVLLPEYSLAFLGGEWEIEHARHIRLDKLISPTVVRECRSEFREGKKLEDRLVSMALGKLQKAKALHDELEGIYRPYMDFDSLTEYTEAELQKLPLQS